MNQPSSNVIGYTGKGSEIERTPVITDRPVIAYRRTSKSKEKDKASFEEQQSVLADCEAKGDVVILESYDDAASARNEHERCERP